MLPLAFSIGLLFRKNWGRLGIIFFSLLGIGSSFYFMFLSKVFYPQHILVIIFNLFIFVTLINEKYKREFIVKKS
jgi:hypothetical protein